MATNMTFTDFVTPVPADWLNNVNTVVNNNSTGLISYLNPATGGITRTLTDKLSKELVSILDFGADPTGVLDSQPALQAAINTGRNVYAPQGNYRLNNSSTLSVVNQRIYGDGRFKTNFLVNSATFNMSAAGVFISNAICIEYHDLAVIFSQPDVAVKSSLIQYPSAISGIGQPGQRIENCRIEGAWNSVDWRDNCGQSSIKDLIYSCFNNGIWLDGAVDTIRLDNLHCWPSGLTANQTTVMTTDTSVIGINSGRADDLKINGGLFYVAMPFNFFVGTRANAGTTFGCITDCDLDGFGGVTMSGGTINIIGGIQTGGTLSTVKLLQSGGVLNYTGVNFQVGANFPTSAFQCFMNVSGTGVCNVTGGSIYKPNDACVVGVSGGTFALNDVNLVHQTNTIFGTPFIIAGAGTQVTATGNIGSPVGTGSLIFFNALADSNHNISGNTFFGYTFSAPINGKGYYGGNYNPISASVIQNNLLTCAPTVLRFIGTCDGSGNFTVAHNVAGLQNLVLGAQAFYKGASGEARPMVYSYVDGTNLVFTGGTAGQRCRVVVTYSQSIDSW